MAAPFPLAMVICDAVHEDPTNHKRTILGTFSMIDAADFPAEAPQFCVYAVLSNGRKTSQIRIVVVDIDEDDEPIWNRVLTVQFPDPFGAYEFVFPIANLRFPMAGEYLVRLFAGDEFVIERKMTITTRISE
jgi:hypothetical protein